MPSQLGSGESTRERLGYFLSLLLLAALVGAMLGSLLMSHPVLTATPVMDFDATLGFPGEGPGGIESGPHCSHAACQLFGTAVPDPGNPDRCRQCGQPFAAGPGSRCRSTSPRRETARRACEQQQVKTEVRNTFLQVAGDSRLHDRARTLRRVHTDGDAAVNTSSQGSGGGRGPLLGAASDVPLNFTLPPGATSAGQSSSSSSRACVGDGSSANLMATPGPRSRAANVEADVSADLEGLALDADAVMQVDAGVPTAEMRRVQARREADHAGDGAPSARSDQRARSVEELAEGGVGGGPSVLAGPRPGSAEPEQRQRGGITQSRSRCFCPVAGCPAADAQRARGWDNDAAMRPHLEAHRSCALQGAVPAEWLTRRRLTPCRVCNELIVGDPGHIHPRCRPLARAAVAAPPGVLVGDAAAGGQANTPMPFDDVFRQHKPTLKHVPKACRKLWTQAVTRAIAAVILYNVAPGAAISPSAQEQCDAAWSDFLLLPQCVLQAPVRGGKKHRYMTESRVRNSLQRWLGGERQALLGNVARPSQTSSMGSASTKRRRCVDLAESGLYGQACRALTSSGIAPASAPVLAALRAKHPAGPDVPQADANSPITTVELIEKEVLDALKSFPNGSAGGASGWRPQHLADAAAAPHQAATLAVLTDLVNLLARGQAPEKLSPYLAGASLIALPKEADDVRPIAIGEPLRRLVSKALCRDVKNEARDHFWPLQIGVASPLGCEAGVHVVSQYAERHHGSGRKVIFCADFSNARFQHRGQEYFPSGL